MKNISLSSGSELRYGQLSGRTCLFCLTITAHLGKFAFLSRFHFPKASDPSRQSKSLSQSRLSDIATQLRTFRQNLPFLAEPQLRGVSPHHHHTDVAQQGKYSHPRHHDKHYRELQKSRLHNAHNYSIRPESRLTNVLSSRQMIVVTISRMLRWSSRSSVIGEQMATSAASMGAMPLAIIWAA